MFSGGLVEQTPLLLGFRQIPTSFDAISLLSILTSALKKGNQHHADSLSLTNTINQNGNFSSTCCGGICCALACGNACGCIIRSTFQHLTLLKSLPLTSATSKSI